jgi:acetyl-CoA acetyltransferase
VAAVTRAATIVGAAEARYTRHPTRGMTTRSLLVDAVELALADAGLQRDDVDGLSVASFTLGPDTAIDFAWQLGVKLRYLHQDTLGGAGGINALQHALRAVEAGDAETIVLVGGDRLLPDEFERLRDYYNRATRDELVPVAFGGPNGLFSMVTQRHAAKHGLGREDYAQVAIAQRRWAGGNPGAVYRAPLTLDEYLAAPMVAEPLGVYDCVPVVSGADAVVVSARGGGVRVRALRAFYNHDDQEGDGLVTGVAHVRDALWDDAGVGPGDMDCVQVYDDYPVMVLAQLDDLGLIRDGDVKRFLHEEVPELPFNTSGGQLSAGQAGGAAGLHGLVEAMRQLRGRGQIENAKLAVVCGYGMVLYRYGACANAVVLEAP